MGAGASVVREPFQADGSFEFVYVSRVAPRPTLSGIPGAPGHLPQWQVRVRPYGHFSHDSAAVTSRTTVLPAPDAMDDDDDDDSGSEGDGDVGEIYVCSSDGDDEGSYSPMDPQAD